MRPTALLLLALVGVPTRTVAQGLVELASQSSSSQPADGPSFAAALSADGRVVAFISAARNLAPGDCPFAYDVFVRDRNAGTTELAAVPAVGSNSNQDSREPSLSADGRFVAFVSIASNLVFPDANGSRSDLFVRDRALHTTSVAALTNGGTQSSGNVDHGSISADGAWVVFESAAGGFVPGDTNGVNDVFVRNLHTGVVERVSRRADGTQAVRGSRGGSLSADGALVAFSSFDALVPADLDGLEDVYVLDRASGVQRLASPTYDGSPSNGESTVPVISLDGTTVAFASNDARLVPDDGNNRPDVFWRDLVADTTGRASVSTGGGQLDGLSWYPAVAGNGRVIGFWSQATGVVPGVPPLPAGAGRVYEHDRTTHETSLIDAAPDGEPGDRDCDTRCAFSADGRGVAWGSYSNNLGAHDAPSQADVFVGERRSCQFTLDFQTDEDLVTPLGNGRSLTTPPVFGSLVRVSSAGANLGATTFDSTPGGPNGNTSDPDMLIDRGNIVMLQDSALPAQGVPGYFDTPSDDPDGGDLIFDYTSPCEPLSVVLIDLDPAPNLGATVTLTDGAGRTRVYTVPAGWTGSFSSVPGWKALDLTARESQVGNAPGFKLATMSETAGFDPFTVDRIVVHMTGRGAMDDLTVCSASLGVASVSTRNGTGVNRVALTPASLPAIGTTWTAALDCAGFGGGLAILLVRRQATSGLRTPFGELLIGGGLIYHEVRVSTGSMTPLACDFPSDPTLIGLHLHAQGLCWSASSSSGKTRQVDGGLSNALDLVLGF